MTLEVVGGDHTGGVVELGHPLLGLRAGSFGQRLRDWREVAARMVEDAVQQQPHAPSPTGRYEAVEVGVVTQTRIDLEIVGCVVAVAAGGEDWTEQQAVPAPRDQVVEPPMQPRQSAYRTPD